MGFQNSIIPQFVQEYVFTSTIAPDGVVDRRIYANKGYLHEVRALLTETLGAEDAISGSHFFKALVAPAGGNKIEALFGESNYGNEIQYDNSIWRVADRAQRPTTEAAQASAANKLLHDSKREMRALYQNKLDVEVTFVLSILVLATRIDESANP